jgi:PAS domain S-box-containing protein
MPERPLRRLSVVHFLGFAAAAIATIAAALVLNARLRTAYATSSEQAAAWAGLQPGLTQLGRLASELGASVMSAFATGNVADARARLEAAQRRFAETVASVGERLPGDAERRQPFVDGLARADERARTLVAEAERSFVPIEAGRVQEAAASLASHDRELSALIEEIRRLRDEASRREAEILSDAQRRTRRFAWLEAVLAIVAGVLAAAAAVYGLRGLRLAERDAQSRQQVIDQLRGSEERLRDSEELYRSVIAALEEGIVVVDARGAITAWNAAALRLLGRREEELAGRSFTDPGCRALREDGSELPGADHPAMIALRGGEPVSGATLGVERGDGQRVWLSVNAVPLPRHGAARARGVVVSFADTTQRRQGERALRDSEARLNAFLEALPMGVFIVDPRGSPVFTNLAARDILGVGVRPDIRGAELAKAYNVYRSGSELPYPNDELPLIRALNGETCSASDLEIRRPEGRVELEVAAIPIRDEVGQIVYGLAAFQDVTERRRRERLQAALHAASAALAAGYAREVTLPRLLEALGRALRWPLGAFWSVDQGARVLRLAADWNGLGPDAHELAEARRAWSVAPGAGAQGLAWKTAAPTWVPDIHSDPGFPMAPLALKAELHTAFASPVTLGGAVLGVLEFVARDIPQPDAILLEAFATVGSQLAQYLERDAADRALRAGEERMRSVLENMLEGLIVSDPDGVIQSLNPAAERMFGWRSWELVGQRLSVLLPRSILEPDAYLRDAVPRALGRVSEWDLRRRDGEILRCELTLYEFQAPAGRQFAGHVRDISEQRKLERMKREFVATVSHELRTPLTSIRGSLGLLAAGALGELPGEAQEVVQIAERNAIRLIGLINDILDLERLETGRMDLAIRPHEVAGVVGRAIDAVAGMAHGRGVKVEARSASGSVQGDEERLVQVLVNLLSNAVKFSPEGGSVTIEAAPGDGGIEFRVSDQGRGIPESYREIIFNRFQQVEASDSRQKGGSGLGLAICKAIVEQHGGSIGVESQPGRGSTFWFRIPAAS